MGTRRLGRRRSVLCPFGISGFGVAFPRVPRDGIRAPRPFSDPSRFQDLPFVLRDVTACVAIRRIRGSGLWRAVLFAELPWERMGPYVVAGSRGTFLRDARSWRVAGR